MTSNLPQRSYLHSFLKQTIPTFLVHKGSCIVERLMKSSMHLQERLTNVTKTIESFKTCKNFLQLLLLNNDDVARVLPNYNQCLLNIDCKLAQWKAHLEMKHSMVEKKLMLSQNQMWWTHDFCKYVMNLYPG